MRRVAVVGAGQAGLLLALGLRKHGYEVTVFTERTAEEIRDGRVIASPCIFDPGLRHERALGLNFWDDQVPWVTGVSFGASGGPGVLEPAMSWRSPLDNHAQSIDQRLKMSTWLAEFARLGGEIRVARATPADLEDYAREFELVLVAAGRGPQFDSLFVRDVERSRFSQPQRAISQAYVAPLSPDTFPGVTFGMAPEGEFFALPLLTANGPVSGLGFFGIPGGPMDCWDGVTDPDEHFDLARKVIRSYFPWLESMAENVQPTGPLDILTGRVTPVVRDAVGTLPSGAHVLAMGDSAITNDPIAGQGANMATRCAAVYQQSILDHGDRPFDAEFMRASFERFWDFARHATRFSNDLLEPPAPHVLATLDAAQTVPEIAHRFCHLFEDPSDYEGWLTDEESALRYLEDHSTQ